MELILKNADIIGENDILEDHFLRLQEGKIVEINPGQLLSDTETAEVIDLQGNYLAPGFIDLHTHGARGADTMDASKESLAEIADYKLQQGTTGFLATTLTASQEQLLAVSQAVVDYFAAEDYPDNLLGIHLEGPHINEEKKGAQNPDHIRQVTVEELQAIQEILEDKLKIITLAPEKEGTKELIQYAVENGIVVSAGHTNASWEEAKRGINWGLSHATHFFNGMKGLHHRKPGTVGAFLEAESPTIELIADGSHIHPAVINLILNCKSTDKVILVTDSMRAAGMEDGEYNLGGMQVIIKEGTARLESGNLAGSTANLNQILKNILEMTDLSLVEAVKLMTINPARKLGLANQVGSINLGKQGNLVVLDQQLNTRMTILEGEIVYSELD